MQQLLSKKHRLLIMLCVFYYTSVGQISPLIYKNDFRIVDSVYFEVHYEVERVEDVSKPEEKLIDIQVLQIGDNFSYYFSRLLFKNDSINTILEEQGADYSHSIPKGATKYEVVIDNNTKTISVTYRINDIVFLYKEDIPTVKWVFHNEKKTIQQYSCQKATTHFRGRDYEAWFTPEIPIRNGPYKFSGLPGLILRIEDSQKQYVFKCIAILKHKPPKPMRIRNWNYTITTRTKLQDFLERLFKNPVDYYNTRGVTIMTVKNGRFIEAPSDFSLPYNPIELK